MDTVEKLNRISELHGQRNTVREFYDNMRAELMGAELIEKLADLEAEETAKIGQLAGEENYLTNSVKDDVLASGQKVVADHLQAVYVKGRVSWDTSKLDVYAQTYPEIAALRREGEPSVSIKVIK